MPAARPGPEPHECSTLASLTPSSLCRFNFLELPHDRFRVVLMDPELHDRPSRAESNRRKLLRVKQLLERFDAAPGQRLDPSNAGLVGGLAGGVVFSLELRI